MFKPTWYRYDYFLAWRRLSPGRWFVDLSEARVDIQTNFATNGPTGQHLHRLRRSEWPRSERSNKE